MGLAHGGDIVSDGLVLCLDAANVRSYPRNGSTWADLSKNDNHGTIYNSLPYSTNNGGYFDFNNTSNSWYVQGTKSSPPVDSDASIEIVFYSYDIGSSGPCLYNQGRNGTTFSHGLRIVNGTVRFRNTNGDYNFSPSITFSTNTWTHIIFSSNSTGTSGYKNGEFVGTTTSRVKANSYNQYVLGRRAFNSDSERFNGRIALVRIYHKELSANEVQQNYLATKGRFGL